MKLKYILIFILIINIFNLSAQTCEEYTIAHANDNNEDLLKHSNKGKGQLFCVLDETQKKIDDNSCVVLIEKFVKKTITGNPEDNFKCIKFYIDITDKFPKSTEERILNNTNFQHNANILKITDVGYNDIHTDVIQERKNQLKNAIKSEANDFQNNITYNNSKEKSKSNFLKQFIDVKDFSPSNLINKKAWENPITVKFKSRTSEVNSIFQKCKEKTAKTPSVSIEEMLKMLKSSVFDLEGQLEDGVTGILDNIQNKILDATSDEAMLMYTIQGLSKLIAMGICKVRNYMGIVSGNAETMVASLASATAASACVTKVVVPDIAPQGKKSGETSCAWLGTAASCFVMIPAGLTYSFGGTTRTSDSNDAKECKILEKAIKDKVYNVCLEKEPEKVMRYILKMINLSIDGGEVEFNTVKECNDKELKNRYKNKNYFDKSGKPYKNRITSFLNKGVDFMQNDIRDRMLGYVDQTLDKIRLEARINNKPKTNADLMKAVKNNLLAEDILKTYPNISVNILKTYQKKYNIFQNYIDTKELNINIKSALTTMVGVRLNSEAQTPFGISEDFREVLPHSNKFLYKIVVSLPAYDYYMNFYMGQDVSGLYTHNNIDQIKAVASSTNTLPLPLTNVFEQVSGNFLQDIDKKAPEIAKIMKESMYDYYNIWNELLIYLSSGFTFDYGIVNNKLTYTIPLNDIKNIFKKSFYKIYLKRYQSKLDSNKKELKSFNINYITNRLAQIKRKVIYLSNKSEDEKATLSKYVLEYEQLIMDYNLYMATYDLTNPFSLLSIIDEANINLASYFENMNGIEIEKVQSNFNYFLKLLNIKKEK